MKVGVLTTERLDDGSGSARVNTFTTKQEFLTGKNTSNSMKYHVFILFSLSNFFNIDSWL